MRNDALCDRIVNTRQRLEVGNRRAIDIDRALLLESFHHALGHGLGIASRGRSRARRLLANLVRAALMRRATGKRNQKQQYEGRKFHV